MGTEISFRVHRPDGSAPAGKTTCSVWVSSYGSRLGFTADAKILRSYLAEVEKALRKVDAKVSLTKV